MLLDARMHSHMHTERQTVRMTLPFELTALGWSKSLPAVLYLLISSGRFDIGCLRTWLVVQQRRIFTIQIYSILV